MIAWTFEPVGHQLWAHEDQQIDVEVDEYGIVEIASAVLFELFKAAGWTKVDDHAGPAT
jgi:hypothetical protein